MPETFFTAIEAIDGFDEVRVALIVNNRIAHVPLKNLITAGFILDTTTGDGLLLSGDEQSSGTDRLLLSGDESGDLLI